MRAQIFGVSGPRACCRRSGRRRSLRKALAVYEIDYGVYPDQNFGNVSTIVAALVDPSGNDYMILPDGQSFTSFAYTPINGGQSYEIQVVATDHGNTGVLADPNGTAVQ
ncbi:MAG: hypothetical protein IPP40_15780 [bacterium]|nr:hypothetical protein [bacterium]